MGQPIGSIFKGKAVKKVLKMEVLKIKSAHLRRILLSGEINAIFVQVSEVTRVK
jgi:hypothetical protein